MFHKRSENRILKNIKLFGIILKVKKYILKKTDFLFLQVKA